MIETDVRHHEVIRVADEAIDRAHDTLRRARMRLAKTNLLYEERMRGKPRSAT